MQRLRQSQVVQSIGEEKHGYGTEGLSSGTALISNARRCDGMTLIS